MIATIAALFVYPVKSCRGLQLSAAAVTERGLARDREWMIVDAAGRFISQRDVPRLALITPALSATVLALTAPGMADITVPFDRSGASLPITIWRDSLPAIDQGEAVAAWLSAWIGADARLVRFDPRLRRTCNPVHGSDGGAHTAFADAYPLLVLSDASLADLNKRLASPLPQNRFRPNVVVSLSDGEPGFVENGWVGKELSIGDSVRLAVTDPCPRCVMSTLAQEDLAADPGILRTAARHNSLVGGEARGPEGVYAAAVGVYARVLSGGTVRRGDPIRLV